MDVAQGIAAWILGIAASLAFAWLLCYLGTWFAALLDLLCAAPQLLRAWWQRLGAWDAWDVAYEREFGERSPFRCLSLRPWRPGPLAWVRGWLQVRRDNRPIR